VKSLSLGALAVAMMIGVFIVPSAVPHPPFLDSLFAIRNGYKVWVLLWAVPMLLVFAKSVQVIIAATNELSAAAERIRVIVDLACVPLLERASRAGDGLTRGAAAEALAVINRTT
jgi:hypothetical protein